MLSPMILELSDKLIFNGLTPALADTLDDGWTSAGTSAVRELGRWAKYF